MFFHIICGLVLKFKYLELGNCLNFLYWFYFLFLYMCFMLLEGMLVLFKMDFIILGLSSVRLIVRALEMISSILLQLEWCPLKKITIDE